MIVVTGGTGRVGRQVVTHPEVVTSTVRDLTGVPAHTFADWAAANAGAFR